VDGWCKFTRSWNGDGDGGRVSQWWSGLLRELRTNWLLQRSKSVVVEAFRCCCAENDGEVVVAAGVVGAVRK